MPAGGNQVAAVRRAYLTWWNARVQEYLTLNPAPVKPYMTAAGYQQERSLLGQFGNEPFRLAAVHNLKVFVYADRIDASVDDIWLSNSGYLDPITHQLVGTPSDLTAEDSTSLKRVNGRWLVDDVVRIGASQAVSGQSTSYAAVDRGVSPPQPLLSQIKGAFRHYESVRSAAYLSLNGQFLSQVETGAALAADVQGIAQQVSRNQPIRYDDQDSYRVALQDPNTAWIYDSVGDKTVALNSRTRAPVVRVAFVVYRSIIELTKGQSGWLVAYSGVISQS